MQVYRGRHFRVVLWRFYVALFGKTALFAEVIIVLIPFACKIYILGILPGGADAPKEIYFEVIGPAITIFFVPSHSGQREAV